MMIKKPIKIIAFAAVAVITVSGAFCAGRFMPRFDNGATEKAIFGEPKQSVTDMSKGEYLSVGSLSADAVLRTASGFTYINPLKDSRFSISGFPGFEETGRLYRVDYNNRLSYSSNIQELAWSTTGGKIRFRTDSAVIKLEVTVNHTYFGFDHFTLKGVAGIDVYTGTGTDKKWVNTALVTKDSTSYKTDFYLSSDGSMQEVTIELPLYAGVASISIGFSSSSHVGAPADYTYEKPVVFYGSSITQGGCASRPGTCYTNLLSRVLDFNLINLGFSGAALGEQVMAEYIGNLDMSALVICYDHNAADAAALKATHYNFYKTIRNLKPDVPIIFTTRCDVLISDSDANWVRREVIKQSYEKAVAEGDNNVYFVSGEYVYGERYRDIYMVDGCHPNDNGMLAMAETLYPLLKQILEK